MEVLMGYFFAKRGMTRPSGSTTRGKTSDDSKGLDIRGSVYRAMLIIIIIWEPFYHTGNSSYRQLHLH
jgi:hypothetical protein